jgi:hypothetical protein
MTVSDYKIQWLGPYRFYGTSPDTLFAQAVARQAGLYLWTIPFEDQYLIYYVGETGRSFFDRFTEHAQCYLHGLYRIYDPQLFAQGEKNLIWEGMWKAGTRDRIGDFLNQYQELSPRIYELLGLFRIFVAPLKANKRVRERIEAKLSQALYENPEPIRSFPNDDIRYKPKRSAEDPISVAMSGFERILGLADMLTFSA